MFNKIKSLILNYYNKYKEVVNYIIFGGLTTLVNYASYLGFTRLLKIGVVLSTILAWILSVLFAYITNKKYVFESKSFSISQVIREIISFFSFRILSGLFEVVFMYVFVDIMSFNDIIMKLIANVVVIILNYIFSKIIVFRDAKKEKGAHY